MSNQEYFEKVETVIGQTESDFDYNVNETDLYDYIEGEEGAFN